MFEENNGFTQKDEQQSETEYTPVFSDADDNNYTKTVQYVPYGFTPETYAEKRDIRKIALVVGLPCLCLSLIGFIYSYLYLWVTTKFLGYSYETAVKIANDPAIQQIMQICLSLFMFLVPFPIFAKIAGYRIDGLIDFKKPQKHTFLPFLLFGVGFCSFANIAMSYCSSLFEGIGIDYEVDYGDNPSGFFGFLLSFIATAIVPALVEEFACRGIILGLLKKYGEVFAIVTSSIVFGVMHGNFDQMPFAVMVGLILGYVYVKSGSIWVSVAVHCANNAVSVIFTYLGNTVSTNQQNLWYTVYLIISLLIAVLGVLLFAKSGKEDYSLKPAKTASTKKQKYVWFFTSWIIIVFLVLNIIESLAYFVI